tara:strand:+ start:6053 stop:7027 length:975 start_codon:yes stop_codon:yes gene_type:complete
MARSIRKRKIGAMEATYVLEPPFPRELLIDISSYCNHACNFCANTRMTNKKIMEPDKVFKFLKEGFECGARDIGLYATGEPFAAKGLPDYVAEAKKLGYEYIYITTNGAGATPERAKKVLDNGLDSIKYSIHAGTRETYQKVHGRDDFLKVIKNLKWASNYRQESGLDFGIYVTMVQTHDTVNEVELLKELVEPYIDEWDPHLLTNSCGTMAENNEIGEIDENNIRGRGHSDICFQPFKSFTVTAEGYMSACVLDYYKGLIVADLNKVTMKEAWHNEVYKNFRQKHLDMNPKGTICYNCRYNADEPYEGLLPEYSDKPTKPPRR